MYPPPSLPPLYQPFPPTTPVGAFQATPATATGNGNRIRSDQRAYFAYLFELLLHTHSAPPLFRPQHPSSTNPSAHFSPNKITMEHPPRRFEAPLTCSWSAAQRLRPHRRPLFDVNLISVFHILRFFPSMQHTYIHYDTTYHIYAVLRHNVRVGVGVGVVVGPQRLWSIFVMRLSTLTLRLARLSRLPTIPCRRCR